MVGISPPVKPMTSSRPPWARERSESVNRSPPTGSTTMSTPRPPVSSFTAVLAPAAPAGQLLARVLDPVGEHYIRCSRGRGDRDLVLRADDRDGAGCAPRGRQSQRRRA